MSFERVIDQPWTQEHSLSPHAAPVTDYPTTLQDIIGICASRPPDERLHAVGSHWALSDAPVSDHTFIETNDPANVRPAMQRTLHNVIPNCMGGDLLNAMGGDRSPAYTFVHVEAGKRIYQLYAELDQVDPLDTGADPLTLPAYMAKVYGNASYARPWGFVTLGGAGGQTVVGALTTGTHGGDFDRPPVADSVMAIHLVADGGKQWWIEPLSAELGPLTDDDRLIAEFAPLGEFEVKRDDDLFRAVLVSAGRFGVIYSIVLMAVPQYSLYERCRLRTWQVLKDQITGRSAQLFRAPPIPPDSDFRPSTRIVGPQRFLQVAVCLTTHANFTKNLAGVTQRWTLELPTPPAVPQGRNERVGGIADPMDPRLQGPRFELAGASHPYRPPDDPTKPPQLSPLESACSDASFLKGVLRTTIDEARRFVDSNGVEVSAGIAAIAVVGGIALLELLTALLGLIVILERLLDAFDDETPLGPQVNNLKNILLGPPTSAPGAKAAGVFLWQLIVYKLFSLLQKRHDLEAVSFAVMDTHDYLDKSCEVKGDSVEVFFDALDDRLIAFIDALIAFEMMQEFQGLAFVGYASLRFTQPSMALLGMQKDAITCSVEVAGLAGVSGSQELVDYAARLGRNPKMGARLHWGQHNDYTMDDVERLYGDETNPSASDIARWRAALSTVTDNGRLDGFSSQFTRDRGLEVVAPAIRELHVDRATARVGDTVTISWDASNNPPGSSVTVVIATDEGEHGRSEPLPLVGAHSFRLEYAAPHVIQVEVRSGPEYRRRSVVAGTVVTAEPEPEAR